MESIILKSNYSANVAGKRMKVRNDSKTKTSLNALAKGKEIWNKHGSVGIISEAHKFGNFGLKQNIVGKWEYTQKLKSVNNSERLEMSTVLGLDLFQSTNNLLRNILLFKGIGFRDVEKNIKTFDLDVRPLKLRQIYDEIAILNAKDDELASMAEFYQGKIVLQAEIIDDRKNIQIEINKLRTKEGYWKKVKPFASYSVNTTITYINTILNIKYEYKVSNITINNLYINEINGLSGKETDCRLLFAKKCFGELSIWIKSLNLI